MTEIKRCNPFACFVLVQILFCVHFNVCPAFADDVSSASMRGFGSVAINPLNLPELSGEEFDCDSPTHATLLIQKLGRDMELSATVTPQWVSVTLAGTQIPVLVRPGLGSFLFASDGSKAYAITSSETDNLAQVYASATNLLTGAHFYDPDYRYPDYLDKWTRTGIGAWYGPTHDSNFKTPDGSTVTATDDMTNAKKFGLTVQLGTAFARDMLPMLHQYDRPYHIPNWEEWSAQVARLAPEQLLQPGPDFTAYPDYYGQVYLGGQDLEAYHNWQFEQLQKEFVNDPNLVDWIEPHGEVGPGTDRFYSDFSEGNRERFVTWLQQDKGYTLTSLGQAWYGDPHRFKSWATVPIPMNYDFYGWNSDCIKADSLWHLHTGTVNAGLSKGYQLPSFADQDWFSSDMPGDERASLINHAASTAGMWLRGTIYVPAAWYNSHHASGPIYLNVITLSHSRGVNFPDHLWVNGNEVAGISCQPGGNVAGQVDISTFVRAGSNSIAYVPANASAGVPGTVFISAIPMQSYPFSDPHLNARYYDFTRYVCEAWAEEVVKGFRAIRGIDPDRPIKMMAAADKDLIVRDESIYGAYGHNTGDEAFFRPWDNRLGYPRGIPASAESSGSLHTPDDFMNWLGYFNFTGNQAFDYFYTMQDEFYTSIASDFKEYRPYLSVCNRHTLKRPDIALLWSSENNRFLPHGGPYCWDLGRGDLQPIGYSYVYIDELGLDDGLAKDYPVLWDCCTTLMSPHTVALIKKYVEGGGTYVALQNTGRSTFIDRDSWPITSVTGFNVKAVRAMEAPGFDSVTILHDQPLFHALAGQGFENAGSSVDYSQHNFAEYCLELTPAAPDTQVIARYDNGSVAIGMRRLGKGRVIVLGSPFWRDSFDDKHVWSPGIKQSTFLGDLFAGLGLKPLATPDTSSVWREHYLATNGTEEYLALWNPTQLVQTVSTDWTTVHPATALYDPKNGKAIPGTINGNLVHIDLTLQPLETLMVATQPVETPDYALHFWFNNLAGEWKAAPSCQPIRRPQLPLYDVAQPQSCSSRIVDAADLSSVDMAAISRGASDGGPWDNKIGFHVPDRVGVALDKTQSVVYKVPLELPPSWRAGDDYRLTCSMTYGATIYDVYLNGKPVLNSVIGVAPSGIGPSSCGNDGIDITQALIPGQSNVLVFRTQGTGFAGQITIERRPRPDAVIDVAGTWQLRGMEDGAETPIELPGSFNGIFVEKSNVFVPAAWKGSRVFIDIGTGRDASKQNSNYAGFVINKRAIFNSMGSYMAPVSYMDITPWVKFGQDNRLLIMPMSGVQSWKAGEVTVRHVELERVIDRNK